MAESVSERGGWTAQPAFRQGVDRVIGAQVGPYRIESELGSGGMGTVYLADHGGKVALKILHPHLLTLPEALERFEREAVIGQRVQHPNVVRTLDVGSTDIEGVTQHYLVMEYVEGQTLRSLLQELGKAPEDFCRHIGLDISRALEAIHAHGVVHRDLKPENVLVTPNHAIKVMDLGVAQLADAAMQLSQTGAFLGSVLYAAPEQFAGAPTDHRADLYALGLMLYELSTGHHPWRGKNFAGVIQRREESSLRPAAEINPQISPFFEELVGVLLAIKPADRFASAAVLRAILEQGEEASWWARHRSVLRERTQRPLRRVRIPRETAVYGREDELANMQALLGRVVEGEGQVLLLIGEAGIGKTRVVDEFVAQCGEDVNFLFGSYPPGGAATEAGAFSTAFREQLGGQDVASYLEETPLLAAAFAALLRGEPAPRDEQPLTKDSLQTVFLQSARALARERPTIVLIDDLHFAPPEGRALFAALAMGVPGHRILLVGTARPELPPDWRAGIESLPHTTRLQLKRLGAKDLANLLVDYFGSERLANELSFRIATSSDGNPFFVLEIIRGLREGNYITRSDDGSWITSRIIEKIEIPSSVAELIQARISTLEEGDHEILDVASCCGFEFDAALVADVIRQPRIPTFRRLARITNEHRLVHAAGRNFVFDHHQVQESLYGALPEILREEYHAAIGNALEQCNPRGSELVHLCEHFFLGGQPERAQPHLDAALDHLSKGYLHEAALDLLDRALAVPGFYEGAARVRKLIDKSKQLNSMGRREEQLAVAEEALALADECGDLKSRARARVGIAAHLGNTSQFEAAEKLVREVLEMGREAEDREVEAVGHEYLAMLALQGGKTESATKHFESAIAIHAHLDDPRGKASLLTNHGDLLRSLGDYEGARALHEESRAVAMAAGDREGAGLASGNLGILCRSQGWIGDALANFEACAEEFRQIGTRRPLVNALAEVGKTLIPLGDVERAKQVLEDAVEIADEIQYGYLVAWCERYLACIAAQQGRVNDADALLTTALARMQSFPSPGDVAETLIELADLRGPGEEASVLLQEALEAAAHGDFHAEAAVARAMLGDESVETEILPALARMRVHELLWKVTGDPAQLEKAQVVLANLREHAPERYRDSMIENVPLHRRIMQSRGSPPPT